MKKTFIILLTLFITTIVISGIYLVVKIIIDDQNSPQYVNLYDLHILTRHNEYVLVSEDNGGELTEYSIYKNIEANDYQKMFTFPGSWAIEPRLVCWGDGKIYAFVYDAVSYDLSNGNVVDRGDIGKIVKNTRGNVDRVLGIYDNYIYYEASYHPDTFYGKISLDLKEVTIIEKKDIPQQLQ